MAVRLRWLVVAWLFAFLAATFADAMAAQKKAVPNGGQDETDIIPPLDFGPGPDAAAKPKAPNKPAGEECVEDDNDAPAAKEVGSAAKEPAAKTRTKKPSGDPGRAGYVPEISRATGPERDRMIASAEKDLSKIKVMGNQKNAEGDYFIIGTIDLENHKAIVDFKIIEGLREAAEWVADFMLGCPRGAIRKWKGFAHTTTKDLAEKQAKAARAQSVEAKLEAFPMTKSKMAKRSNNDSFVIGTAELHNVTKNADIRFEVLNGVQDAASFLIEFIISPKENTQRQWHVFFRGKSEDEATDYRKQLRNWYDTMVAQRDAIAQIYNARSTRRT